LLLTDCLLWDRHYTNFRLKPGLRTGRLLSVLSPLFVIMSSMEEMEREVKKQLRKSLRGVAGSTLESLVKRILGLPYDRVALTTDIGGALASINLRAAVEMFRAAPEVSRLIDSSDMRVWGEIGKRLSATSADSAMTFFQTSAELLQQLNEDMRSPVLRLVNKQAALSANTALESFRSAPSIISSIHDPECAAHVLTICLELSRHSVKHSNDLFLIAPQVVSRIEAAGPNASFLLKRGLALTSLFAFRSGGTAAEFFSEIPAIIGAASESTLSDLFQVTESYLDRSGGVALQYFKAASRALTVAGEESFARWTALAKRVALQGNAASYHFMKQSPAIISELVALVRPERRAQVVDAVLEIVEELADRSISAAVECFKASPLALRAASLGQFRDWARRGIDSTDNARRIQAYYALESKASQEALFRIEGGLTLDSVSHTLRLYVEGLTGRSLNIASMSSIPDEAKIGDGKTIYLPSVVAEFEGEQENFRLFKVLAAHAAGQVEFQTYSKGAPDTVAALTEARTAFAHRRRRNGNGAVDEDSVDFTAVLAEFPNPDLATRLFGTIENGRIDYLLRAMYRGIRRDLDFVRSRLIERRPHIEDVPGEMVPFELLFQLSICGGPTPETRRAYPIVVGELQEILSNYILRDDATVADSLLATRHIYDYFVEQPTQSDTESDDSSTTDQTDGENSDASLSEQNAEHLERRQMQLSEDPFSLWASGQQQDTTDQQDVLSRLNSTESAEQDLEKGDRAFYYDEWDRELGDYRTRWCRIVERGGARGSRGFVELVRNRYAGVISSIRYQFQLLRPENLRRIRGEIDGEDYDLQAVIDYALDKRSTGLIDDRLYTRKLRRERDVAVSFLLDMSSSTARTISRYPNHPYTQPGQRIIDIEKEGLVLMSEALEAVGDSYSMQGFTSEGRRNVKFYVIKDFSEGYSSDVERRIGGITYQNNTRLGAAIRHAITRLAAQDARTKLLIVLSDGRPYDHDYGDSRYAREDTRMALRQARVENITPFCITIDRESEDQLKDMYGEVGYTIIDDVLSLPERLPGIYSRLTT
jgi:nitric oxide reductase NorD protein